MSPENAQLFERLAVALAIGLLIGLERGWEYRQLPEGGRVAGIRTFGLLGVFGAIAVQLGGPYHELFLSASILAIAILMGVGYWRETTRGEDVSITTSIAALLTFGFGAMAGTGHLTIASSAAVVITLILGFRLELHSMVAHIEREELFATLRLLLISVVMLPILPNRAMGPWGALNPYQIWWMVVMIAAISYVGYFAIKFLGERRGVIVTGLFGGMTSSTAVTLTLSPIARDRRETREMVAAAVIAASAIMFPRMLIIAAVVAPNLAMSLAAPLAVVTVVSAAGAGWLAWRSRNAEPGETARQVEPGNPLKLWFAIKFGLMLAVIMIVTRAAKGLLGDRGLFSVAGISGLADVDAITLSASTMANQGQARPDTAEIAILIAAAVNTILKPALMTFIAGFRAALPVWISLLAALGAGAIVFQILR
jgi:uncharacterized membrane protein (DUF4010 family)